MFVSREDLNSDALVRAYEAGESAASLARRYKANIWTILSRLREAGVHIRTRVEQNERRLNLGVYARAALRILVDGLLLGDGSIDEDGSLRLEQAKARRGWLTQVKGELAVLGGACRIIPRPPRVRVIEGRKIKGGGGHLLYTPAYVELKKERQRWYPRGVKRVPYDIRLTAVSVAQWLAGDGTYDQKGRLVFCTEGFVRCDVDLLVRQLGKQLAIRSARADSGREAQFKINILDKNEAVRLADLVRPHLPRCCLYKLRYVRAPKKPEVHRSLTTVQARRLLRMRKDGASYSMLAACFNVSVSLVAALVAGRTYKDIER